MALRFDAAVFGRLVMAARERRGISQERFAEMVGVSQATLSRIESGTGEAAPRIDTVLVIEECLGRRPFSIAAQAFGLPSPGEPEEHSLLEDIRFSEELTDTRKQLLLEVAELMVEQSRLELGQGDGQPGPRRGRPRRSS